MADVSDKEKETSKLSEKEQDTAGKKSPKTGSAKGSRAGSPQKSPKGSRENTEKGRGTPSKGNVKAKGKAEPKKKEEPAEPPPPADEDEGGVPEGVVPLFLSSKTQEIFHCRADEDVTDENPIKIITKDEILEDMRNRAAICDFHPVKQQIIDYPTDEILVVYDADFKYGQNFYVALTEEAKEKILNPGGEGGEGEGEEGEEDTTVYKYIPPEPKEWVSQGSEKEIKEESVVENRRRIKVSVKRIRKEFGAPYTFQDRNVSDAKDGYVECTPYDDRTFELKKIELDKSIQSVPETTEMASQTDWKYPRNANTQYAPREFSQKEKEQIENSKNLTTFIEDVTPRFKLALQQNEIMDVFYIDWQHLGDAEGDFGNKSDNHLKEYQSFTDLQFSKEKRITCIQWHPTVKGVVAVSVAEKMTFDDRIDHAAKVIMTPSLILIWSFTDPIHPQLLLEAPDDIYSFQFSPSDPNIICGGCINGQVVLWDISAHADRLKQPRGGKSGKKLRNVLPGFEDPNALKTPIVRYCAVSSIEHSHRAAITDLLWLPDHMEVNRMGVPQENKSMQSCQIMTCATDYSVLFWDTRPPKGPQHQLMSKKDDSDQNKNPMGIPTTFKHLDLVWKPMLKVHLHKSEPGGDHSPTKFSIQERQGHREALSKATEGQDTSKEAAMGGGFYTKPGSGKDKRTLQSVKTHFYVGTEDGEIVYVDWMPQKDQDTGKIQTPKPDFYHTIHDGIVNTVQRSPFFKDIVLCVGGWTFTIWKEGVTTGPILQSAASPVRMSAGHWSPSRPAVFYIAKEDGNVDVWDILDKTHEPTLTQSITSAPITEIYPYPVSQKQHLLAVGDNAGTLHILEIPWSLRQPTPNEHAGVSNYFEREVKRRAFVVQRWDFREQEKRELEAEQKRKAGIAPNVVLTDEEIEYRLKQEYQQYVDEETAFLRELGILKEEEEPLPET